jgi:hypothetical protein
MEHRSEKLLPIQFHLVSLESSFLKEALLPTMEQGTSPVCMSYFQRGHKLFKINFE